MNTMKRICYLIFRLLFLLDGGVWSLRNMSISVPRAVLSGEGHAVLLRCSYDLEGAALYSIRWYRAETEFYRYVPREMPPTLVFPLPGASVDLTQSDYNQVRVLNMHRRLSGEYQCEVSADAPLFHTAIMKTNLTVVDPPYRAPRVTIERSTYARGDVLRANCSVDEAYPACNITWLVDGHKIAESVSKVHETEMDFKERTAFSQLEITMLETDQYKVGLSYTSSALHRSQQDAYVYDRRDLYSRADEIETLRYSMAPPSGGHFTIACTATLYDVYARPSDLVLVREDAPRPASVTGGDSSVGAAASSLLLTSLSSVALAGLL